MLPTTTMVFPSGIHAHRLDVEAGIHGLEHPARS